MQDDILFKTKNDYLTIKKCQYLEFFYLEKKGLDSISVVLLDKKLKQVGLLNEGKLSFTEREQSDLAFKISTINGGMLEHVEHDVYKNMDFNEQMKVAFEVTKDKILEKTGYDVECLDFINRTIFNYNSNEYTWLFVAEVDRYAETHKENEGTQDDVYTTVWFWQSLGTCNVDKCQHDLSF